MELICSLTMHGKGKIDNNWHMLDSQKFVVGRIELEHPKWLYANATWTWRDATRLPDSAKRVFPFPPSPPGTQPCKHKHNKRHHSMKSFPFDPHNHYCTCTTCGCTAESQHSWHLRFVTYLNDFSLPCYLADNDCWRPVLVLHAPTEYSSGRTIHLCTRARTPESLSCSCEPR